MRGVQVELAAVEEIEHPALEEPTKAVMIDLEQSATAEPEEFWGIGCVNPNPFGITCGSRSSSLRSAQPGHPRQVDDVVTLQEDVDLASVVQPRHLAARGRPRPVPRRRPPPAPPRLHLTVPGRRLEELREPEGDLAGGGLLGVRGVHEVLTVGQGVGRRGSCPGAA